MRDCRFEIRRKIDDRDGLKRASRNYDSSETHKKPWNCTHFLTQMPHPMQRNSEMNAILSVGFTSIQSLPAKTTIIPYTIKKKSHAATIRVMKAPTHFYDGA